jgi:hypothetical protein
LDCSFQEIIARWLGCFHANRSGRYVASSGIGSRDAPSRNLPDGELVTDKHKRRIGTVPADWLTESDVERRGTLETQRTSRIGGPPRGFGETRVEERAAGPITVLVVSEDRHIAARLVIELAARRFSIRLAFGVDDVDPLLHGVHGVFAVVPHHDAPVARALRRWRVGRNVIALVPDGETALRLGADCDTALIPPWNVGAVVGPWVE